MLFHNRTAVKLISQISCAGEMTLPQSSLEVHALSLKTLHNMLLTLSEEKRNEQLNFQRSCY